MKINRHFVKNILLTISFAVLTLIIDVIIINFYCYDTSSLKTNYLSSFYELELCTKSLNIISYSIFTYASIIGLIGLHQLISTFYTKKNQNQISDIHERRLAAQVLIIISISIIVVIRNYIAI